MSKEPVAAARESGPAPEKPVMEAKASPEPPQQSSAKGTGEATAETANSKATAERTESQVHEEVGRAKAKAEVGPAQRQATRKPAREDLQKPTSTLESAAQEDAVPHPDSPISTLEEGELARRQHREAMREMAEAQEPGVAATEARRKMLNAKFGRSGNLDADINTRGIDDAIKANASIATVRAVAELGSGAHSGALGTKAHQIFQRLNNRLANRVAGDYKIVTEEFRDVAGFTVAPRSSGSIGADIWYEPRAGGTRTIYDLKTFALVKRAISSSRQLQVFLRFGAYAREIFERR